MRFDYFQKMSVCASKVCETYVSWQKCLRTNSQNFMKLLILCYHKLILAKIAQQMALQFHFSRITWISSFRFKNRERLSQKILDEIGQKLIFKTYIIRNKNDEIQVHVTLYGALLFRFSQNCCDNHTSHSVEQNFSQFFACYTLNLKDDINEFFDGIASQERCSKGFSRFLIIKILASIE